MVLPWFDQLADIDTKTDDVRSFDVKPGFAIRPVDGFRQGNVISRRVEGPKVEEKQAITVHPGLDKSLGNVLDKFVGTFGYVCYVRKIFLLT